MSCNIYSIRTGCSAKACAFVDKRLRLCSILNAILGLAGIRDLRKRQTRNTQFSRKDWNFSQNNHLKVNYNIFYRIRLYFSYAKHRKPNIFIYLFYDLHKNNIRTKLLLDVSQKICIIKTNIQKGGISSYEKDYLQEGVRHRNRYSD